MNEENKEGVQNEEVEEVEEVQAEEVEAVVEKPVETLEARKARLERQLEQTNRKLGVPVEKKEVKQNKSGELDYGKKAFLNANGIKGSDEIEFVQNLQKETGKELDALLETSYFQAELREFRDKKATSLATPKGSKRSNNSSIDTVEYWINKGEYPTGAENKELREKIVNAQANRDKNKGIFYNS